MSRIFDYAGFYFGLTRFDGAAKAYGEEFAAELAAVFHEEQIFPGDGAFQDIAAARVIQLAQLAGLEDVSVKHPGTLYLTVFSGGRQMGFVNIDIHLADSRTAMVNGDTAGNLHAYGWKGIRNLEKEAARRAAFCPERSM